MTDAGLPKVVSTCLSGDNLKSQSKLIFLLGISIIQRMYLFRLVTIQAL